MDNRSKDTKYQEALNFCSSVAKEEYIKATDAVEEARKYTQNLREIVLSGIRSSDDDETIVGNASKKLKDLLHTIDNDILREYEQININLLEKKKSLDHFTITLFGRTMAGKSTIREALTNGDGSTIGKGAQRTTRDIREYRWNNLRIIDTPGIGAYEGNEDKELALSIIDQSDIVLFLLSTDGIQEEVFKGMKHLREQNKTIIFVLNVKTDLTKSVYFKRFLREPTTVFDAKTIEGHSNRIKTLAVEWLGMNERAVKIIPIHAQAAFLSTREEYNEFSTYLIEKSRINNLMDFLENEVTFRGRIRRLQTVIDGTANALLDVQLRALNQSKLLRKQAKYLKDKFAELDVWLDSFISSTNHNIESDVAILLRPIYSNISVFVDDNIEREDVSERWKAKIEAIKINEWLERRTISTVEEINAKLIEFTKEMEIEKDIVFADDTRGPKAYNPWDIKRTLKWTSAGTAALAGVASVAVLIGSTNFWNPVGWVAGAVSVIALGLSWFFSDREKKLQKQKARATEQLREQVKKIELKITSEFKKWFYQYVTSKLVRGVRKDTKELYTGIFEISHQLELFAKDIGDIVHNMNSRLVIRTAEFIGASNKEILIKKIARDPGVKTKILWHDQTEKYDLCRKVGLAIGEWIDGIPNGSDIEIISKALKPAKVLNSMVYVKDRQAIVKLPKYQIGKAIGRDGYNISLACRLSGYSIKIFEQEDRAI